ncbi:MAG: hypothetical protein GX442_23615 [Candidatus Riflebacteria bacterium]|nr:hypothetical protein [Candidatus Riflebacteria bacterium]
MNIIYRNSGVEACLTTDHPASSYNQPVLVAGDKAFGPRDRLPSGMPAAHLVRLWQARGRAPGGKWGPHTPEAEHLAAAFVSMAEQAGAVPAGAEQADVGPTEPTGPTGSEATQA